jgi:AraC-like DNA-binding protein
VRIDRAKWMLAHYDIPVKEVAMRCGFEESSYFCQVFRRRAKLTPVEYRLKYQRRPRGYSSSTCLFLAYWATIWAWTLPGTGS